MAPVCAKYVDVPVQKQKMHETDVEVERLAHQLADLRAEMVDLEAKERVMLYNLQGMQLHSENLFAHKVMHLLMGDSAVRTFLLSVIL